MCFCEPVSFAAGGVLMVGGAFAGWKALKINKASHQEAAPPAKIANRLRPHLVRWRAIDARRSGELRAAGLMKDGEEIRFVINRMHDGQPLAGKIRSAWEGILEDAGLGEDVVRHSLRHTAAT